jgi:hypothetical protein
MAPRVPILIFILGRGTWFALVLDLFSHLLTCTPSSPGSRWTFSSISPCSRIILSYPPPNSRVWNSFRKAMTDLVVFSLP